MKNKDMEKLLAESMKQLDEAEIAKPELTAFAGLIRREQRRLARSRRIQFMIFLFLAVVIPLGAALCMIASTAAFLLLQGAAFAAFLAVLLFSLRKEAGKR